MRKSLVALLVLMMTVGLIFAAVTENTVAKQSEVNISSRSGLTRNPSRDSVQLNQRDREDIFWQEDFENGWNGWTSFDATFPRSMWHLSETHAYGGEGYSWWMADSDLGGYYSRQYTVLDTPEILVTPANSTLTFKLNYYLEEIGSSPTFPDYNGWDAINVRISTNGGNTWNVISGTPAYDANSMFSFGHIHGEGPGVPGWGGNSNGWIDASFNLSQYENQTVKIRFAFASDGAVDTESNPEYYSALIDNISLGDFVHDFNDNDAHGMTFDTLVPLGGDLWHIGTTTPMPPSPDNAAICQNEQQSYNPNMQNYIFSPLITLPNSGNIRADFMITGEFFDNSNTFPNSNYWGWEISPNSGVTWYAMSNPYGGTLPNYVFSDAPDTWSSATASYNGIDGYISEYAGETVQFRIFFQTTSSPTEGPGIMFDDFTIFHEEFLPEPLNLVATPDNQVVHLQWQAPTAGGSEGWIHWDSGENVDGVGVGGEEGGEFSAAARFTPLDMNPYVGGHISKIKFFPTAQGTFTLKVWSGVSGNTVAYEQLLPAQAILLNEWNEFDLLDPVLIEMGQDYWIGYNVAHAAGLYPAGCDAGPAVPGGDMIKLGAGWSALSSVSEINSNWNIQGLVEILEPDNVTRDLVLTGFNLYHSTTSGDNYALVETFTETETEYIHQSPAGGVNNFYVVTALYDDKESDYSNEASAFVMSPNATEFYYDNGNAVTGLNAGTSNHIAVKFVPTINEPSSLTHIKVYVETVRTGSMVIKVMEDAQGIPGTQLSQFLYPATQVVQGWNLIPIPSGNPIILSDYFFVAIQEVATSSAVGVDGNPATQSYTRIGSNPWAAYTSGNIMIRAIIDGNTNVAEELLPVSRLTARNYPNPFNPETNIALNIPQAGIVKLTVFNIKGQVINTLLNEELAQGSYTVVWSGKDTNGNDVSSGVYFYKVETADQTLTRRMLLLK